MSDSEALMLSVSGCRGIVGSTLTPEVVSRFAAAFATWLRSRRPAHAPVRVVVGRDGRLGGQWVRDAAVAGLAAAGCDVIDLGVAMTATVGVMADELDAAGGMVVTASHNPQQWNGLKCLVRDGRGPYGAVSACAPDAGSAGEIIELFRAGRVNWVPPERVGSVRVETGSAGRHAEKVLAALTELMPLERITNRSFVVVVDSVNASGVEGAGLLLRRLGCQIVHLNADRSGVFPHAPEPIAENLGSLAAAVAADVVHAGFAQDPDADRLALVDDRGVFIGEEYTLALAAWALLGSVNAANHSLAANLSTSRMVDDVAARSGSRVLRTPVGEANVVAAMRRESCVLGGEGNGGVIWPRVTLVRDSLSAMALTLALLTREGRPLSDLVSSVPSYAIEKRKVPVKPGLAERAIDALARRYADQRVDRQDGVRIDFPARSAWVHVRASNTEPIVRLIAEAPTAAVASTLLDEVRSCVE
ncbi:MAG: phosphoglucosamine mutase [Phycisphaerae bacterium]|nr:phosphoglucosamine mutase [Phycisphaerae bacterium]